MKVKVNFTSLGFPNVLFLNYFIFVVNKPIRLSMFHSVTLCDTIMIDGSLGLESSN